MLLTPPLPADEAALVLAARGIPCSIAYDLRGVLVPPELFSRAESELDAYLHENRREEAEPSQGGEWSVDRVVVWEFAGVAAFLAFNLGDPMGLGLQRAGSALGTALLGGQWYRPVTALTLHADPAHLLGNLLFGFVCFLPCAHRLGRGLTWFLLLLGGVVGNWSAAWLSGGTMDSIGASTSVMAEAGMMAGMGLWSAFRQEGWGAALRGGAAGLAVFSMLGLGDRPHVDYLGHVMGFLAGVPLGFTGAWLVSRWPGLKERAWPGLAAVLAVAAAWAAALLRHPWG